MANIRHPISRSISFSKNMGDLAGVESLEKKLDISDDHLDLSRCFPGVFDSVDDK